MFDVPQRQSPKVIAIYAFKNLKGVLLLLLYNLIGLRNLEQQWMLYLAIGLIFIILSIPVFRYWFFTFCIKDDELIIQSGVLFKERKTIPIDRVQSVHLEQNLIHRIMNITAVEIDTAGSNGKELEIPGLEFQIAKELKTQISTAEQIIESTVLDEVSDLHPEKKEQSSIWVMQLGILDLLKVGITQNHLKSGFLAIAIVFGFWNNISEVVTYWFGNPFENWDKDLERYVSDHSLQPLDLIPYMIAGLLFFVVASVLISLVGSFNKYYGFSVIEKDEHLEIEMGLLKRIEVKVPIHKVQYIEMKSNPLRKLLGYKTAYLFQATSQEQQKSKISIPACTSQHQQALKRLLSYNDSDEVLMNSLPNPWAYVRLSSYIMLPFVAAGCFLYYFYPFLWIIPLLLITVVFATLFNTYKYARNSGVFMTRNHVGIQSGWIFPTQRILPIYKSQAVRFWQSVFIKKRDLGHIEIHAAAGKVGLKYLPAHEVKKMNNYINNRVISDDRDWM